jgi:alpha-1,3-rhamnosyl/mannosyltransferase
MYRARARAFPSEAEKTDVDVVWTPTPSVVKGGGALTVSTVCDVNPLLPDGRNAFSRWRRARRFRRRVSELGAASWRVATDSEDARKRLAEEFPKLSDRLKVVPLFAHPSLQRVPDVERDVLLKELDLGAGYMLFVGSFRRHKNWDGLMKAYAMCPEPLRKEHPLVLSGAVHRDMRRATRLTDALGIAGTTRILGETPERFMPALYSGALLFVFPTFMEGFGLPALEAMQCGVPVIATDRTAVPEVLGGAPRYIDPADLPGLAAAMRDVLASPDLRERMTKEGLEQARRFNAGRTGEAMRKVLRSAG